MSNIKNLNTGFKGNHNFTDKPIDFPIHAYGRFGEHIFSIRYVSQNDSVSPGYMWVSPVLELRSEISFDTPYDCMLDMLKVVVSLAASAKIGNEKYLKLRNHLREINNLIVDPWGNIHDK